MKNILYIAQFKDASGYANAARGYLRILDQYLDKTKYNLKIFTLNFEKQDYSSELDKKIYLKYALNRNELLYFIKSNKYTLIMHGLPNFSLLDSHEMPIKQCLLNKNKEKSINMVAWETDKVPKVWLDIYKQNLYDHLIVFCNWNKKVYELETGIKTSKIYHAIFDHSAPKKYEKKDKFRIFSMSQWQHRKGFDILIRAYCQEFFYEQDTELFIKTYRNETSHNSNEEEEKKIIISDINNYKNNCFHYGSRPNSKILLKTSFASEEEIKKLYYDADVYCSPTRGEAFGMTIAQAALSGLPCIIPNIGGHIDYLDKNSNYFIESRYEPAFNLPFYVYSSKEMNIIEPSLLSTRQQLRKAYNDWKTGEIVQKSIMTRNFTLNELDTNIIFNKLLDIIG